MRREIQTQRLALLRLLAGWLAVVVLLSALPFAPVWTRWMCSFLSSVIGRAETAAQCLVFVQARLMAADRGIALDWALFERWHSELLSDSDADEPPSLSALRRRLLALRCLLRNLPRRAMRFLRRLEATPDASGASGRHAPGVMRRLVSGVAVGQCCPPTPWHPPDRVRPSFDCDIFSLPPNPERRRWRVCA